VKLLLDSNALVWGMTDTGRLSARARGVLRDRDNELFVSIASLWELAIKISKGKLPQVGSSIQYLIDEMREQHFDLLPIHPRHLLALGLFENHHRDPFDRLIVAQAISERLPIVTSDILFSKYPVEVLW
jgi:PIN domain nuclease of toxin-antitoxin system